MNVLVMLFTMLVCAALQAAIPALLGQGIVRFPLLLGIVIYYALLRSQNTMLVAAVISGLIEDCLGLTPLGYSTFCYCVCGLAAAAFRDVVVVRQWATHALFGSLGCFAVTLMIFLLLVKEGQVFMPWLLLLAKMAASLAMGALVVPLVFAGMDWLDRTVGNVQVEET